MSRTVLGHSVQRTEDPALVTGAARYLDDLDVPDVLHAVFVRSTVAHARVLGIDASAVRGAQVFTADDLDLPPLVATGGEPFGRPMLAREKVRFVGEAVAVVVASSKAQAADAAEDVLVDYDPLPVVTDPRAALEPDAPQLFDGGNAVSGRAPSDDPDFFADAGRIVRGRFEISRVAPVPMETNGCIAIPDGDTLTIWASTQSVFGVRKEIAEALGMDESAVRVRAPSVGGGFGAKGGTYTEQFVVAALARRLGRPVKWTETRSENLLAMTHGRAQVQEVSAGVRDDGTVTALRATIVADAGAYPQRAFVPFVTRYMSSGPYRIPKIDVRVVVAVTNTSPTGPYRGAGRPEAAAMLDRMMDLIARELSLDPAEVRRRNLIGPDAFPYTTPSGAVYDSGEYERALDLALELAGYDSLRAEQRTRTGPVRLGIGLCSYVEVSGLGSEYGSVAVQDDGTVRVVSGSVPNGQGHETAWAQIVSDVLGVPMDAVRVEHSDTGVVPRGTGTFGSRSLQLAGAAVLRASQDVWERARTLAADLLEASPDDIVAFDGGRVGVAGTPAAALRWDELASRAPEPLRAELDHEQIGTFPFGTHVAVVEVDTETGAVALRRLIAVDDCGTVVNPMLVAGQVHGGIAQGASQILYETFVYDDDGNPLTATLAEYLAPSAADLPSYETAHTETPTPQNPLGAKGVGESGTTGAMTAVWNAVIDALDVDHLDMPLTPERVWNAAEGRS